MITWTPHGIPRHAAEIADEAAIGWRRFRPAIAPPPSGYYWLCWLGGFESEQLQRPNVNACISCESCLTAFISSYWRAGFVSNRG